MRAVGTICPFSSPSLPVRRMFIIAVQPALKLRPSGSARQAALPHQRRLFRADDAMYANGAGAAEMRGVDSAEIGRVVKDFRQD